MRPATKTAFIAIIAVLFSSAMWRQAADVKPGIIHLQYVTVLVKNYDEALAWYTRTLGLKKIEDRTFSPSQRWIDGKAVTRSLASAA